MKICKCYNGEILLSALLYKRNKHISCPHSRVCVCYNIEIHLSHGDENGKSLSDDKQSMSFFAGLKCNFYECDISCHWHYMSLIKFFERKVLS